MLDSKSIYPSVSVCSRRNSYDHPSPVGRDGCFTQFPVPLVPSRLGPLEPSVKRNPGLQLGSCSGHQPKHHSTTLPCMSCNPQGLGSFIPTQ